MAGLILEVILSKKSPSTARASHRLSSWPFSGDPAKGTVLPASNASGVG
jgi:hypothetical protein